MRSGRCFVGETPIALLLDGGGSVADLRRTYGVHVARQSALEHPGLRALKGSTKAKLAALWVSPFFPVPLPRCGRRSLGRRRPSGRPRSASTSSSTTLRCSPITSRCDDAEAASRHFPEFDAARHEADYVNTGAFFAQRDALDLDRYLELVRFSQRHPGVFFKAQGIFNFLVFSGADEGTLRVDHRRLQVKVGEGDATHNNLVRQFRFTGGQPSVTGEPVVIHWVGTLKTTMQDGQGDFFEPMAFFRRQYRLARQDRPAPNALDDLWLRFEDVTCGDWRGENLRGRLRRRRRRAMTQFRFLLGRGKIAARARLPSRLVTTLKKRLSS